MIRTLDQAQKDYYMTYYKCHCEHCNGDFVVSIEDLHESEAQFGMPKVANDEYVWKCPACGHPNMGKNIDLEPCYQNGQTNIMFELTDEESSLIREFEMKHSHPEKFKKDGKQIFHSGQFTYEITPEFSKYIIKIQCNECGEIEIIDCGARFIKN